ncbi:membrane cofactor protein-like isoform X2 [Notolabrus celidotus]|uniref:membrane cofactor protein-like isoform X2 n=1 Tax=Notolabrus celidotus TaxID=1203425 RepID=UPI00148FB1F4|nr:membrane cofactor protein-like isoform X2 [Notolabrus celidotus]
MTIICLFLLSSLGLALTVQARGCERPVLGPNMSLKGTDILLKEFPDGTKVGFTCNDGYIPRGGPTTSTCTNGEWSAMAMQCEKKNCGSLGEVPNGDIDYSEGTEFGNTAVVTCQLGYTLVGSSRIHCGNEGWMNRLPNCEVVACETPAQITDGTFSPEKENYEYREVIHYTCRKDFTLSGSVSRMCSENGSFSPEAPVCTNVQCAKPDVKNANRVGGFKAVYMYKEVVEHECQPKYTMSGKSTSVCDINGKWTPALLKCEANNCTKPVGGSHMSLQDTGIISQIFPHDTSVTFACDDGYQPVGGSAIKCTTGEWSSLTLRCQPKNCTKPVGGSHMSLQDTGIRSQIFPHDSSVTFVCDAGYQPDEGSAVMKCTTGEWSSLTLRCQKIPPTKKPGKEHEYGGEESESGGSSKTRDWVIGVVVAFRKALLKMRPREGKESLCRSRVVKETDNRAHSNFCTPGSHNVFREV